MKRIEDFLYDESGGCPVCGGTLRAVPIFAGERLSTSVRQTGGYVRTTTVQARYNNIRPMRGGFCEACDRKHFIEQQRSASKPSPIGFIAGLVMLAVGLAVILLNPADLGRGGTGAIFLILVAAGALLFMIRLGMYVPARKRYAGVQDGKLEAYVPKTDDALSEALAAGMNRDKALGPGWVCFSTKRMREMKAQNPLDF